MTRYSVQPRDRIFVKGYGILPFAKNMGKNIGKNISKILNLSSATDALKTSSKRVTQKKSETTGYFLGNKIANRITIVSRNSQ